MLTPEQLAEIKERLAAAHEGEWIPKGRAIIYKNEGKLGGGAISFAPKKGYEGFLREEDAAFAAHAHQDVPALLAEVERLRAELDQVWHEAFQKATTISESYEQTAIENNNFEAAKVAWQIGCDINRFGNRGRATNARAE